MAERDFNMELLIKEIHSRPLLWNPKHKDYANKDQRNRAWDELCITFDENYYKRSPEKQIKMFQTIRRKYKSLRDSYQRERNLQIYENKIGDKNSKRKKYVYFDQLHFLSTGIIKNRRFFKKPSTNFNYALKKKEIPMNQEIEERVEDDTLPTNKITKQPAEVKEPDVPNELITSKVTNITTQPAPPLLPGVPYSDSKNNEEDTLFLLSLVKEIKKIPEDSRLPAKIDILQTISRWQTIAEPQHHNLTFVQLNQNQLGVSNNYKNSSHLQKSAYQCPICQQIFGTKTNQRNHLLKTHINNGFYACSSCSMKYIAMKELIVHMKMHNQRQTVVSETSNVVDHCFAVKDESMEDACDDFDEPDVDDAMKFDLSYSDDSHEK